MSKNILKLLGNIAIEQNKSLTEVCNKYCDFYSESSEEYLDQPIVLEYSEDIYNMTFKYYLNAPKEDEIISKWKGEANHKIKLYNYKGGKK